ncbi:MAG: tRNA (adenine(22)-N(1))-methyltransferase [Erysipelotrichaceae bacterium]
MLSKRLDALADFVEAKSIVADVGCDHALLLVKLAQNHKLKKGYAMDVATGPLQQALINTASYSNIECLLSNGLEKLPLDTEIVIIAGMGYLSIKEIISSNFDKLKNLELIVQCNSQIIEFRNYLNEIGANIIDELWVFDYKDYQFIKFNFQEKKEYSLAEIYFGPIFLKNRPSGWLVYHQNNLLRMKDINKKNPLKKRSETIKLIEKTLNQLI